ncbi:plasmodesmata-located protein 2 [Nymphaea colorata]|nr:plasmodesmata-located protein 2 [Nymphaea colorata]
MGPPTSAAVVLLAFCISAISFLLPTGEAAQNLLEVVYQGCSSTTFPKNGGFDQTLTSLFSTLTSQASQSRFYKTSAGSGDHAISALFQCRGDLSNGDCSDCVKRLPEEANRLCGPTTAARVQLQGCYLQYTAGDPNQVSGTELLYSKCASSRVTDSTFLQMRQAAFSDVQNGIQGGSGFYTVDDGGVYALGQCEGDLSISDCGVCLKSAFREIENRCGGVKSGQVYLSRCYATYAYYPDGGAGGYGNYGAGGGSSGHAQQTGKTVAIVVGGAALLFFVFVCLCFVRSLWKKHDDY